MAEMMPLPDQLDLIDGTRRRPADRAGSDLCHPDTGEVLAPGLQTAPDAVSETMDAAHRAHVERRWQGLPASERARMLDRVADELEARSGELAVPESLNTGIPIAVTGPMTGGVAGFFRGAAERVRSAPEPVTEIGRHGPVRRRRLPFGPAVVIAPWNAPSPTIVGRSASALAAGCPVIVKPSEWAPGTADIVATAVAEAQLPPGAFQLVHGGPAVGAQLVADPRIRVVSFTGGQGAGRAIAAAAAPNFARLQLELGANNPAIVRADADITDSAVALAAGMTKLNGQWCEAPGRVLAHHSIVDDLVEALLDSLRALPIGSCLDEATAIGPLSHGPHLAQVRSAVDALVVEGGVAHDAGVLPDLPGWFMAPTVVTGLPAVPARPEVFGPVLTVHAVDDDAEALAAANDSTDGLAAYVFSTDIDAALDLGELLRAGEVRINGTGLFDLADGSHQSFWGTSGLGGHGDTDTFELFRGHRIVGVDDPHAPI
ncbi:MAG: aldehyde dehydrogenase [Acidimicrobiales bacterium]|nr:aldehyde dehydrogenase [Acidimicrobiales bacterium]